MEIKLMPPYIEARYQDNGLLYVRTNTHIFVDLPISDLFLVIYPYAGKSTNVELNIPDVDLKNLVYTELIKGTALWPFFQTNHPVMENAWQNWYHYFSNKDKFFSINSIKDSAKGKSVLFLGAGPSLNRNLKQVKKMAKKGKHFIVAGGSAIRICCQNGIIPDLCLAFDPNPTEYGHVFEHLTEDFLSKTTFLINQGLHTSCSSLIQKAYVMNSSSMPALGNVMNPGCDVIPEGVMGVSTMIPHIAQYMGCDRLYMLGVDLTLTDDGKRYVDAVKAYDGDDIIDYEGVKTRLGFAREAECIAQSAQDLDIELLNLSSTSLLSVLGIKRAKINDIAENRPNITDIPLTQSLDNYMGLVDDVSAEFRYLNSELGIWRKSKGVMGLPTEEAKSMICWEQFIGTYDLLQTCREIRTGDYNYHLIEAVINRQEELLSQIKIRRFMEQNNEYYEEAYEEKG